jgi:hypothetical protein
MPETAPPTVEDMFVQTARGARFEGSTHTLVASHLKPYISRTARSASLATSPRGGSSSGGPTATTVSLSIRRTPHWLGVNRAKRSPRRRYSSSRNRPLQTTACATKPRPSRVLSQPRPAPVSFIDPLGCPLSPVSVWGVRRREMREERRRPQCRTPWANQQPQHLEREAAACLRHIPFRK